VRKENNQGIVRSWPALPRGLCAAIVALALPMSAQTPPDRSGWQSHVTGAFTVVSGNLATAARIAVIATENSAQEKRPEPFYGAVLSLPVSIPNTDTAAESRRLTAAFNLLQIDGVEVHVWTEGLAGLLVRSALDNPANTSAITCIILLDVPNRGVSPSGWPEWSTRNLPSVPPWAVSGSNFLRKLNAKTATQMAALRLINVWRRGPQ